LKEAIYRKLLQRLKKGKLNNPAIKRNIRLKSTVYEERFRALEQYPHIIKDLQNKYERTSYSRGNKDLVTWTKGTSIKKPSMLKHSKIEMSISFL